MNTMSFHESGSHRAPADPWRIHQRTKEMVAAELRLPGDPCLKADGVVRRTLPEALQSAPEGTARDRVIEDAASGALTALFLADVDLGSGALRVVEAVLDASAATTDPAHAMTAALKGLAEVLCFADKSLIARIGGQIDARFMGAGGVFFEALRTPFPGGAGRPA